MAKDTKDMEPADVETEVAKGEHVDGEVEEQDAAELPDREAMSLINGNIAAPINAAVALNALSDNSTAVANAHQDAPIKQSN
jgi:hypothetical protein